MHSEEVLTDKSDIPNDHPSTQGTRNQELAKDVERLRAMTVEERFLEIERLYAEGQKIKRTAEEIAAEEAEIAEVRERWVRLKRAYLGEPQS